MAHGRPRAAPSGGRQGLHAVRGPKHRVKKGKTPILTRDEARWLLDSIPVTKKVKTGHKMGLPEKVIPYELF